MGEVDAVVFDIGGVILHWDPRQFYRRLVDDEARVERLLAEICTAEWNADLDRGRCVDEACDELARLHPDEADLIHAWRRQDEMVMGEIPGTADIIRELQRRGMRLYLLTNMPADVFAQRRARFAILSAFCGAIVSGEEGVLKPEREMFDLLTTRYGLDPSRSLFIDDLLPNVQGAVAAGLHAHLFVDAQTLRRELVARGLLATTA